MDLKISVDTNRGMHEREENGRKTGSRGKEAKEGIRRRKETRGDKW